MTDVCRRIVFRRQMAGRAHTAWTLGVASLPAVCIMTVAARHAARVHLALQERAPLVHFPPLLAVRVIEWRLQQRRPIEVVELLPRLVPFGDLRAPRMTLCARLDLALCMTRSRVQSAARIRLRRAR